MPSPSVFILGLIILAWITCYLGLRYLKRHRDRLGERRARLLRVLLVVAGASGLLFPVGVILHNAISAIARTEEPVFFVLAVIVAPLGLIVGLVGSIAVIVSSRARPRD